MTSPTNRTATSGNRTNQGDTNQDTEQKDLEGDDDSDVMTNAEFSQMARSFRIHGNTRRGNFRLSSNSAHLLGNNLLNISVTMEYTENEPDPASIRRISNASHSNPSSSTIIQTANSDNNAISTNTNNNDSNPPTVPTHQRRTNTKNVSSAKK